MPRMKKKEMNEAERKYRLAQNYRHFVWRIMVYLKAHPDILNANNNQEVYGITLQKKKSHTESPILLNAKKETIGLIRLQRSYILLRLACFCVHTV